MTVVKFLQDFQGVETNHVFYERGQVVDVPSGVASRCVADGRAELVKEVTLEYGGENTEDEKKEDAATATAKSDVLPIVEINPTPETVIMTTANQSTTRNRHGRK